MVQDQKTRAVWSTGPLLAPKTQVPPTQTPPKLSSSRKKKHLQFLKLLGEQGSWRCMAHGADQGGLGPAPLLFGRKDGAQLSFFLVTVFFFFLALLLRNIIAHRNNLVPPSDPHRARARLQAEGYRWLELEVVQTEHGLAGQLEVGHRDCDLLMVMVPGHNFYHITLVFGSLGEAEHG